MPEQLLNNLLSQGPFVALFGYLLFYVLKENSKRERKYQKIIHELSESFNIIREDVKDIKVRIFK